MILGVSRNFREEGGTSEDRFGTSAGAFHSWHERLTKTVDAIDRHDRELAEREGP